MDRERDLTIKDLADANKIEVSINLSVTINAVGKSRYNSEGNASFSTEIPLSAFSAVDLNPITKGLVSQALAKQKAAILADENAQQ